MQETAAGVYHICSSPAVTVSRIELYLPTQEGVRPEEDDKTMWKHPVRMQKDLWSVRAFFYLFFFT